MELVLIDEVGLEVVLPGHGPVFIDMPSWLRFTVKFINARGLTQKKTPTLHLSDWLADSHFPRGC
jgi:hypothetical protein